jgi:hypothetical protein
MNDSSSFKNKHKKEQTERVIGKQAHNPLDQPDSNPVPFK